MSTTTPAVAASPDLAVSFEYGADAAPCHDEKRRAQTPAEFLGGLLGSVGRIRESAEGE